MNDTTSTLRNPKECFSIVEDKTFFVLNELSIPSCEDGSEPLLMHDSTFSRFKIVIINAERKAATANIPASAMPGIFYKVDSASYAARAQATKASSNNTSGPAYTVQIASGTLRGKTPAQALSEDPGRNRTLLENQVDWLEDNLSRYPRNQVQIDAIVSALELFDSGKLEKVDSAPSIVTVYSTGVRPLVRRQREDGKCFVYEISIGFQAGIERPIGIEIRNYYAPVLKKENGMLNVMVKERDRKSEIKNQFWMKMENWLWFQHVIEAQMRTFENINAPYLYKKANAAETANRLAANAAAR